VAAVRLSRRELRHHPQGHTDDVPASHSRCRFDTPVRSHRQQQEWHDLRDLRSNRRSSSLLDNLAASYNLVHNRHHNDNILDHDTDDHDHDADDHDHDADHHDHDADHHDHDTDHHDHDTEHHDHDHDHDPDHHDHDHDDAFALGRLRQPRVPDTTCDLPARGVDLDGEQAL
jgi:hypothetical protein